METVRPQSPEELAAALRDAAGRKQAIRLAGAFSKDRMGGPLAAADVSISTASLTRVLQYEPDDLTISVEAGMPWADLAALLEKHRQMVPLDPPFWWVATVGGVVAANCSGPRRRLYGSARDAVIGMKFATLEGKLVQSGGMVVKNVAGLDMAKLMIGSFGTLAAIAVVNFKLTPMPERSRTFILRFRTVDEAIQARDRVLASALQPAAMDIVNPGAAARIGLEGYSLLLQAGGSEVVLGRYSRELPDAEAVEGGTEVALWTKIREFTPAYLEENADGAVVRHSTTLAGVHGVLASAKGPVVARAGTGVVYEYFEHSGKACLNGSRGAVEFSPVHAKPKLNLWPAPGSDFDVMVRIKQMFDPDGLLNRGRLYGRI